MDQFTDGSNGSSVTWCDPPTVSSGRTDKWVSQSSTVELKFSSRRRAVTAGGQRRFVSLVVIVQIQSFYQGGGKGCPGHVYPLELLDPEIKIPDAARLARTFSTINLTLIDILYTVARTDNAGFLDQILNFAGSVHRSGPTSARDKK